MNYLLIILAIIVISIQSCQTVKTKEEDIDELVGSYMDKDSTLIGIAVGVVKDSSIFYLKGFGIKDIESKKEVTRDTRFILASTCKLFTATAIMKLVEQGTLHLDSPVVHYLPYFQVQGVDFTKIKVKHLITHTSGLPRHLDHQDDFSDNYANAEIERVVRKLQYKTSGVPNLDSLAYAYSGYGFAVASDLVSKASDMPFTRFVQTAIFNPLGMDQISFRRDTIDPLLFAFPHEIKKDTTILHKNPIASLAGAGTGTAISSITSMSNWLKSMIDYTNYGSRILKQETFKEMITPFIKTGWHGNGVFSSQGLGYQIGTFKDAIFFGHGGASFYGSNSLCIAIPSKKIGVVVLTNSNSEEEASLALDIINILTGKEPQYLD